MNNETRRQNDARRKELAELDQHELLVALVETAEEIRDLLEMALEDDD